MAEPEKNPFEQIGWVSKTKAIFVWLRERFGTRVAVSLLVPVGVAFIAVLILLNWDHIKTFPVVPQIIDWYYQKPIPAAPAGRLTIAVAHLDKDKDREHETLLLDELGQFEGVEVVSVDRSVDPEQPDKKKVEEKARGLLQKCGADVLIWGSVISLSGKSAMRLYWTPTRDIPGAKSTGKYRPQTENDTIELPPGSGAT
jgi:hypothetical protein